ncbi:MAG: PspC domain-containing protein [Flavobacteriaceae bacterium]|nr:PspC domain-containing protein [Flavobacteriaceae bacterium]
MSDRQDQINQLLNRLETLLKRQEDFTKEVQVLRDEIILLKRSQTGITSEKETGIEAEVNKEVSVKDPEKPVTGSATKKLYRDINHNILGGVCAGLAEYLNLSRILVRFLWVLVSFIYGLGFIAYIILWIVLPKIKKETFLSQQQDQAISDSIVDEVAAKAKTPKIHCRLGEIHR